MRVKTEIKNLEHTLYTIALKKGTILALVYDFLQRNEGASKICKIYIQIWTKFAYQLQVFSNLFTKVMGQGVNSISKQTLKNSKQINVKKNGSRIETFQIKILYQTKS